MDNVVYLNDATAAIRPKTEVRSFHNQRYVLTFDPNSPPDARWHWLVKFTRIFEYRGACAGHLDADKAARKQITSLESRIDRSA